MSPVQNGTANAAFAEPSSQPAVDVTKIFIADADSNAADAQYTAFYATLSPTQNNNSDDGKNNTNKGGSKPHSTYQKGNRKFLPTANAASEAIMCSAIVKRDGKTHRCNENVPDSVRRRYKEQLAAAGNDKAKIAKIQVRGTAGYTAIS